MFSWTLKLSATTTQPWSCYQNNDDQTFLENINCKYYLKRYQFIVYINSVSGKPSATLCVHTLFQLKLLLRGNFNQQFKVWVSRTHAIRNSRPEQKSSWKEFSSNVDAFRGFLRIINFTGFERFRWKYLSASWQHLKRTIIPRTRNELSKR